LEFRMFDVLLDSKRPWPSPRRKGEREKEKKKKRKKKGKKGEGKILSRQAAIRVEGERGGGKREEGGDRVENGEHAEFHVPTIFFWRRPTTSFGKGGKEGKKKKKEEKKKGRGKREGSGNREPRRAEVLQSVFLPHTIKREEKKKEGEKREMEDACPVISTLTFSPNIRKEKKGGKKEKKKKEGGAREKRVLACRRTCSPAA